MKHIATLFMITIIVCFLSAAAHATVPHKLGLPVVLKDESGNRLDDGTYTVTLRVLDADENVLYQEAQSVDVKDGVANMALGDGTEVDGDSGAYTGGIPASVFDSSGAVRYVQIEVEGYLPQTLTEVESVAYAITAERADGVSDKGVTTAALADGAVTEEKLGEDLYKAIFEDAIEPSRINASLATTDYVNTKLSAKRVLNASQVDAHLGLTWSQGTDLGSVIKGLDASMTYMKEIYVKNEVNARTSADTSEASARADADTGLQTDLAGESAARVSGDAALTANLDTEAETRLASDVALEAEVVLESAARQVGDEEITTRIDEITTELDPTYVNAGTDDTLTGTYQLVGSLQLFPEGEDPTSSDQGIEVYTSLSDHSDRIANLESSLDSLDFSEVDGQIDDSQVPGSFTRDSELSFTNITGQVADAQVPDSFTRDTELASAVANYLPLSGGTLSGNLSLSSGSTVDGYDISATLADINNISGTLSASKIDSTIARDSEINSLVTSIAGGAITSGTVSQSYIDSAIARDSEINSEVTSISGGAISSGTVSASYIDSAMATDSELSSAVSSLNSSISSVSSSLGNYLPLSGGTMTGNIGMAEGKLVDGVDVSVKESEQDATLYDHETRIGELEGGQTSDSQLARAHLSYKFVSTTVSGILESYNIASVTRGGGGGNGCSVYSTVTFASPLSSDNYAAVATSTTAGALATASEKTTNSVVVKTSTLAGQAGGSIYFCATDEPFDLVVFAN